MMNNIENLSMSSDSVFQSVHLQVIYISKYYITFHCFLSNLNAPQISVAWFTSTNVL